MGTRPHASFVVLFNCGWPDKLLVAFLAPPWGQAFDPTTGLDLRGTVPPMLEIVDFLLSKFPDRHQRCAIPIHENVVPVALAELRTRFEWSTRCLYDLNRPRQNHGILLGTTGWIP